MCAKYQKLRMAFGFSVVVVCGAMAARASAAGDATPLDRFKSFLSAPAVVERLVFSERVLPDSQEPGRFESPVTDSQIFRYYEARWQPGGSFLREIVSPERADDLHTPGLLAAYFDGFSWFHDSFPGRTHFVQFSSEATNSLRSVTILNSIVLQQVLMFGIMNSEIGSLEWQGNRFRVRRPTRPLQITCELIASRSGLPDSLHVNYSSVERGNVGWIIRYGYGVADTTEGLPSLLRCFWIDDKNREIELKQFTIYNLKTRQTPLEIAAFSADRFKAYNNWQTHLFITNDIYAVSADNTLQRVAKVGSKIADKLQGKPVALHLALTYTVWGTVNASIFVLALRMRKTNKSKTKN
jgi:hypothetical protein